jgi:hypothetical protein
LKDDGERERMSHVEGVTKKEGKTIYYGEFRVPI